MNEGQIKPLQKWGGFFMRTSFRGMDALQGALREWLQHWKFSPCAIL